MTKFSPRKNVKKTASAPKDAKLSGSVPRTNSDKPRAVADSIRAVYRETN